MPAALPPVKEEEDRLPALFWSKIHTKAVYGHTLFGIS
jgi:hypothetical protein